MPPDPTCRIVVIGDEGVGKTSLIAAAATETFPDHPPPVLPPARLPADTTPEGVPVIITDSSSRPEDKQALELACQQASVIVLCFSMDKPATLRRVSTYWMPELRRLGVHVPVMLVGCKSDVRPADSTLHQAVLPIVKMHPQIETCMECSAKKLQFVGEVFYYALKAVVHPMAPLYDPEAQQLRPLCAKALKRIFLLCDTDKDGVLNDAELNAFQVQCFNAPLQPEELIGVKQVVSQKIPQGIINNGLSLPGFLFLHALFIERGRLETTWAVLRRFGYNNELELSDEVLDRVNFSHAPDQVVELTEAGRQFFTAAFERFDKDDDSVLSLREQEELFSTAPSDPWASPACEGLLVETSRKGLLTLNGFLAKWAWTTAHEPRKTLAHALYLGYPDEMPADRLFSISRPRRQEKRSDALQRRSVLQCYVFCCEGGEAAPTILEGLIAQARPAHGSPSGPITAAAAAVSSADGSSSTTLLMQSYQEQQAAVLLGSPAGTEQLQRCDVAAFVFDGRQPESFRQAVQQMVAVASAAGDALPCLLVAANDQDMSPALAAEVGEACSLLAIKPPMPLGAKPSAALYQAIVQTAVAPELAIPETPTLKATRQYRRMLRRALIFTGAGTAAALAGYLAWRLYKEHRSTEEQQQPAAGLQPAGSSLGGGLRRVAGISGSPGLGAALASPAAGLPAQAAAPSH